MLNCDKISKVNKNYQNPLNYIAQKQLNVERRPTNSVLMEVRRKKISNGF